MLHIVQNNDEVPLMFALENVLDAGCIKTLLDSSAPKQTDRKGCGYFHYLCRSKCQLDRFKACCNTLLATGENISLQNDEGKTPLMFILEKALEHKRTAEETTDLLEFLISIGVYLQISDNCGRNLMHYLFSKGAEAKTHCDFISCSAAIVEIKTWCISAEEDSAITSIYFYLKSKVAAACFHTDKDGVNPFMLALQNCAEFTFVKDLLTGPIINKSDENGDNYFHYLARSRASNERYNEIKSALIDNGIDEPDPAPKRLAHFEETMML